MRVLRGLSSALTAALVVFLLYGPPLGRAAFLPAATLQCVSRRVFPRGLVLPPLLGEVLALCLAPSC